jgi:uncharacterized membrane protein
MFVSAHRNAAESASGNAIDRGFPPPREKMPDAGTLSAGFLAILLLAGIVHIVTILLVPHYSGADGWSRAVTAAVEEDWTPLVSPNSSQAALPGLDPLFVHGLCKIEINEAPAILSLEPANRFWSLALYNRSGTVVFSLNDRTAVDGALEMLVVNSLDAERLKESPQADLEGMIIVKSANADLIAVLRLYAPEPSDRSEAQAQIAAAQCAPAPVFTEN